MISSLFGQTRPVNYILVLSLLLVFFILAQIGISYEAIRDPGFLELVLSLGCLVFSIFMVNFIVQRNQLTMTNSFAIVLYGFFLVLFPETLLDPDVIYATVFLLLALRRLISMRSMKNLKAKIFDGALWVFVAAFFINWTILYVFLVWAYIYFYVPKQLNYWLIPLAAGVVAALTGWSVSFLLGDPSYLFRHFSLSFQMLDPESHPMGAFVRLGIFLVLSLAAAITSFIRQGKSGQGKLTQSRLIALGWFLGVIVVFFTGDRFRSTIMFLFLPAAVFMARYIELVRREVVRDLLMVGVMVLCVTAFVLQWVAK